MANVPPKVSTQYITYIGLVSQASTLVLKSNPTIASGDFKVSIDGGALANLGTLPTVTPASSTMVKVTLSTSEMAGANATLVSIDAAGAEWCDRQDNFQTVTNTLDEIYAKVSALTFTVANQVDVNVVDWKGATAPAMTGDAFARLGAPAGASVSADIAAVKADTAAVKVQTDKLAFTVANQVDSNVLDWKGATAPAMTGDAFARLGAPAGASVSADVAAVKAVDDAIKAKTDNLPAAPASTTNITAGVITTVTNLTNAPTAGDLTATMKASVTTAATAATPTAAGVTADVGITQAGADKVWGSAARTLTSFGTLVADTVTAVWAAGTRTLTSYGTLVADVATAVWGAGTRVLTAGTNIVLAKGVGVTGFNDLDAAGIRGAVGLASANLDTQLAAILAAVAAAAIRAAMGLASANLDTQLAAISSGTLSAAGVRAAVGLAAANLDTQLAAIDADVLTRLATAGYTAPLSAAGTRTAVGLAAANLDTQLAAVQTDTNDIQTRLPAALVGGRMDSNIGALDGTVLQGDGTAGNKWRPL